MSTTITVRLSPELAAWISDISKRTGVPRGRLIREAMERLRDGGGARPFMRLAGSMRGPRHLSSRKGFSKS